jgi:hypothetical protein
VRVKKSCHSRADYSNYKNVADTNVHSLMKIEIAFCLFSLALLPACSTTSQTTTANQTLEQRLMAKYASNATEPGTPGEEPAPPAEGPEDVPADAPATLDQNPALMPSPLLRYWASSRTP